LVRLRITHTPQNSIPAERFRVRSQFYIIPTWILSQGSYHSTNVDVDLGECPTQPQLDLNKYTNASARIIAVP
jgi:hypothetical protein